MSSFASAPAGSIQSSPAGPQKVVLFPEGPGYIFISRLDLTGLSKLMVVRSLEDGRLYVRKESHPYLRDPSQIIQSAEVRAVKQIQHINAIPRLTGWTEYHDEVRSNNVITATLWELCDVGTFLDLQAYIGRTTEPVSAKLLFSLVRQMLRAMLDTMKTGVLHTDAHAANWFVSLVDGDKDLKVVLGDWGSWVERPNLEEHQPNELAGHQSARCALCQWYRLCQSHMSTLVVPTARDLMSCNEEAKMAESRRASSQTSHSPAYTATQPLISLEDHLKIISTLEPQSHETGQHWLQKLENAYENISRDEACLRATSATPQESLSKFRKHYTTAVPAFKCALNQLNWLGDDPVHVWKVAEVDLRNNTVLALEGRPDGYRRDIGYKDYTAVEQLPWAWRQAHGQMKEMLNRWGVEEEQPEDEGGYGWQDEGVVTESIDTSMPF